MIIVNYWQGLDEEDVRIDLVSVVNDVFCVFTDPNILTEAIENQEDIEFKKETLYILYLQRASIEAPYPMADPSFGIVHHTELKDDYSTGVWSEPVLNF